MLHEFKDNNIIVIDGRPINFGFDVFGKMEGYQSYSHLITEVIDYLYTKEVNTFTLAFYPFPLFIEKNLSYDLCKIIYNLMEYHCNEAIRTVHNDQMNGTFKKFLKGCKELILERYPLREGMESVNQMFSNTKDAVLNLRNNPNGKESFELEANKKKITNTDHALTYVIEMYATGKVIPRNKEGLNQKQLIKIGIDRIGKKTAGSGFVKELRRILKHYDINKEKDLKNLSPNWRENVLHLTKIEKGIVSKYLENKGL